MLEDQLLIQGLIEGDQQAVRKLMERYQHYVYTILSGMLYPQEAAEASQDTFIKVYKNISRFERNSKLSTWIYRIAYRTGLDYIKKRRRHKPIEDVTYDNRMSAPPSVNQHLDVSDARQGLSQLMNQLKADEAAILRLFYFDEMNIHEVSEITNHTVANVKVKLHRARKKLKELIENQENYNFKELIGQE